MAGAGYRLFNTGDVLTAAQVNTFLQEQVVMRFANAAARTTALSGVLAEGMMSYLDDTNAVQVYNGSAWVNVGEAGDITAVTAGTGISGGGTSGDVTITNSMATAIDAKGDLIAGTGDNAFSRIAAGANGETLVADSSTSTGLRYSGIAGANLLAGGSFDIWQRGTGPFTANQVFTSDRLFTYSSTSYSLSQETSVIPAGATNAARVTITSAGGFGNHQFALEQQEVEKLVGQTVTFSVFLRANATYNGSFAIQILSNTTGNTNLGGTWSVVAQTNHVPSTSAYTRVSVTGTIPSTAKGLAFMIAQNAGLANGSIYYFALAKAEIGSVATPWSRAGVTLAGELAACQRYYWRSSGQAYCPVSTGMNVETTDSYFYVNHPVPMRTSPTTVDYSTLEVTDLYAYNTAVTNLVITSNSSGRNVTQVQATHGANGTRYRVAFLRNAFNTAGYIGFSAEL